MFDTMIIIGLVILLVILGKFTNERIAKWIAKHQKW